MAYISIGIRLTIFLNIAQAFNYDLGLNRVLEFYSNDYCNNRIYLLQNNLTNNNIFDLETQSQVVVSSQYLSNSTEFYFQPTHIHQTLMFRRLRSHATIEVPNVLPDRLKDPGNYLYKNLDKLNGYLRKDEDL